MSKKFKIIIGVLITVLILFFLGGFFLSKMLYKTLPSYSGELKSNQIKNNLKIYRDSLAFPYIFADSDEDAAFAIGYVHAQERLFQMDLIRRAGEGRLSEVFGEETVPFDKMFLTVGIKRIAFENLKHSNPITKNLLTAYSKGVNYFIKNNLNKLPIEFDILGYEPYEWKPEHSLMIIRLMAWELNISWYTDFSFTQIAQKIGVEKAKEIIPDYPENAPTIIPKEISKYPLFKNDFIETDKQFRNFIGWSGTHIGSNNWVVNGNKSVSGKPIIANDPHLAFTLPGKWIGLIINSNNWKAAGVSLPGVPAIVIGKNQNISWVLTNVMADDADFYVERFDSSSKNYFFNDEWKELKVIKEKIKIKNQPDEYIEIKLTHRGPIVSDIHFFKQVSQSNNNLKLSMRWIGNEISDEFYSSYKINTAKNWNEFKDAVSFFSVPGQNFVYGDKEGNIGYICGAKLPIRNTKGSSLAFDGTTNLNDWNGFVPFKEMPMLFNPTENFIASANNKTVKDFNYHISNIWEPFSRSKRINELLTSKEKHSVDDFQKYQTDILSPYAREITKYILNAFDGIKITDKNLETSIELFKKWNFKMEAFSQTPTIYASFLKHLLRNIFLDDLGEELFFEYCFVANVPYRIIYQLLAKNDSYIIDNCKTSAIETKNEIIRKSLGDALTELETKFGTKLQDWQWGKIHQLTFKHFFNGQNSFLDKLINIGPFGVGGDGTTLFNTEYPLVPYKGKVKSLVHNDYENILGPSMRFIYDFANPDEFYLILPTGQSGQILSEHYKNQSEMWLTGKTVKINSNPEKIKNSNMKLLSIIRGG